MKVLSGCKSVNLLRIMVVSVVCILGFNEARAEEKEKYRLEEVVVTATKTKKDVRDVPASVSVITSDEIEEQAPIAVGDVLRNEPGVAIAGGPRALQGESPNIRGLSGARVLLKIDEVRDDFISAHKGRLFIDVDDVERIEIVRGPASSLYGSDAIGGVIQVFTKTPKDKLKAGEKYGVEAKGQYDSVNTEWRESARVFGMPFNWLEFIAGFTHWDSKGFETPSGGSVANSASFGNNISNKLILHPTDNSDLKFNFQYFLDNAPKIPSNATTDVTSSNVLLARDTERQLYDISYDYTSEGSLLPSIHSNVYWHLTELLENALTGTRREDMRNFNTFGFEVRGNNKFGIEKIKTDNSLTYGVEFYEDRTEAKRTSRTGIASISGEPDSKFQGIGIFLQDEIEFLEKLVIIPGLRWDFYKADTIGQPVKEEDRFSPKLGMTYRVTDAVNIFGNVAWGFRAPRPSELFASGRHFPGNTFQSNPNLKPEKSINYELGFKSNFGKLKFDSSVFLLSAEDFIETTVSRTTTRADNIGKAIIWGIENSAEYDIGMGFSTFVTHSYLWGNDESANKPLGTISPDTWVLGLRFTDPKDRFWAVLSGRLVDRQNRVPGETNPTAAYNVWDIKTGLPIPYIKGAKLTFGVENIFDKAYREHLSSLYAPGRNFVVGLSETIKW